GELDDPNEPPKTSFVTLVKQIRSFRVESYLSSAFTPGLEIEPGRTIPWRYRLESEVELPGSGESTVVRKEYYFTERVEGTLQGGGSEEEQATFILTQTLIDAWADLFPTHPLPEEYDAEAAQEAADATGFHPRDDHGSSPTSSETEQDEPSAPTTPNSDPQPATSPSPEQTAESNKAPAG
ncbi:MAG: hypothetical protein ACQKBT_01900, partial [Puniceicoccales bacterium]